MLDSTWLVQCPNSDSKHRNVAQGWSLSKSTLDRIEDRFNEPLIDCGICKNSFSLVDGVTGAFVSDLPIDYFRFNTYLKGTQKVKRGQVIDIEFSQPFDNRPEVKLTPQGPIAVTAGDIWPNRFSIFAGRRALRTIGKTLSVEECDVSWAAFGNRGEPQIPLWRRVLSYAKNDQARKDCRLEIVDLESAFEVFVVSYLRSLLISKGLKEETIDWLLKHDINTSLKIGYREATGKEVTERFPNLHQRWFQCVKRLRDKIVHQGIDVSENQARNAREIVFRFIVSMNQDAIEEFKINLKTVEQDRTSITYGVATMEAGTTSVTVSHGFDRLK